MKVLDNTNTKGLVKYQNLLKRMYKDFDVLPIGMIPKKYLDEVKQQVVIELVKEHCYVVISKTDKGYSVFLDIEDNYETLDYNGEEYVSFKDLKHILKQIDFDYFIKRNIRSSEYETSIKNFSVDILDEELPF
jgi:hypothetical protein